jgi:hypothetical protein
MLQHKQCLGRGTENGTPSAARIFQSQLSLRNVLNRRHAHHEVLPKYLGNGKRTLLKKYGKLPPQGQGWLASAWSILTEQAAISKLLEPDFDLEQAICIGSESDHEFLMDLV